MFKNNLDVTFFGSFYYRDICHMTKYIIIVRRRNDS